MGRGRSCGPEGVLVANNAIEFITERRAASARLYASIASPNKAPDDFFCRGGRTGQKIHLGHNGSSVLQCGHWCKTNVSAFKVRDEDAAKAPASRFCEKCFWNSIQEVQS